MGKNLLTSVEITDTHIKLVQAMVSHGGAVLTYCDVREIVQYSDAEVSRTIAVMAANGKVRASNLIGIIPRRFAILRHLTLPSHADEEIRKMINLQIIKQVPYPREDVILDHAVLAKESTGYSKVLVFAIHKEVVGRYLKIFNDAGLPIQRLTLSSVGLMRWFVFQQSRLRQKDTSPAVVINVDTLNTEICFCHNRKLLFSRSINFGARDLNEAGIANLIEEINLTVATYVKENIGENISRGLLVSSLSQIAILRERMEAENKALASGAESGDNTEAERGRRLYAVNPETLNPLTNIPQKKSFKKPIALEQAGVSLAVGLGLVLEKPEGLVNLIPSEVSSTRENRKRRQEWSRLIILLVGVVLLFMGTIAVKIYKNSMYLQQLQGKISEAEPAVREVKEKVRRLNFIKERFNPVATGIDIIYELYNLAPAEISFSMVHLGEDGTLDLQGTSETGSGVNALQRRLVNSSLFGNVTLQYATKRKIFKGELTDFKITCHLVKAKEETP
ncbi:MAG TPA: pilus assembly protein PilM [Candidatus Omnitrophota bacterium]|nr:pilus assembly protein PilM [Candidatus Omnitrophota bacterium]HPD84696.1 pilus assembly protein PilM [Candidatus Omnitrophota bacterium]HRZ03554.1 pilus assembly protein PilM [Candidatus Omnitrophota bacterium]